MSSAPQQAPGLIRVDLQQQDLSVPGRTVTAGEALTVPAEAVHAVHNVGDGDAAELATYVVAKGKPLIMLAD